MVRQYLSDHNIHSVGSSKAAFGFVKAKRADLFVSDVISANTVLQKYAPKFDGIIKLQPPLGYSNIHTYIAEKFPEIVSQYNAALARAFRSKNYIKLFSNNKCD